MVNCIKFWSLYPHYYLLLLLAFTYLHIGIFSFQVSNVVIGRTVSLLIMFTQGTDFLFNNFFINFLLSFIVLIFVQ